jgi:hypothetical protein
MSVGRVPLIAAGCLAISACAMEPDGGSPQETTPPTDEMPEKAVRWPDGLGFENAQVIAGPMARVRQNGVTFHVFNMRNPDMADAASAEALSASTGGLRERLDGVGLENYQIVPGYLLRLDTGGDDGQPLYVIVDERSAGER